MDTIHLHVTGSLADVLPQVALRLKQDAICVDLNIHSDDASDEKRTWYDIVFENTPAYPYMLEFLRKHARKENLIEENYWYLNLDTIHDADVREQAISLVVHVSVENYLRIVRSMKSFRPSITMRDVFDFFRTTKKDDSESPEHEDKKEFNEDD